jgi:cobalt-zinc-cadmium efflux system membrane fusion protein
LVEKSHKFSLLVELETAERLGIEVKQVTRQRLAVAIKTTGKNEALTDRPVQLKAPVDGTLVKLLVQPGEKVKLGQPLLIFAIR